MDIKSEQNIVIQIASIDNASLLNICSTDRGLVNPFCDKKATPEQEHDLLISFRGIGQEAFLSYVNTTMLKQPSTCKTIRKKRLQTFSAKKKSN